MRNEVLQGDALEQLRLIPSGTVQTCVTSPPYWGLRDYGHRKWFAGDNPDCQHGEVKEHGPHHPGQVEQTKWKTAEAAGKGQTATTQECLQCGAWYGQVGLEPTPQQYVVHLVEIFREVRRVLRDDGTLWLNLGDSWANDTKWGGRTSGKHTEGLHGEPVGRGKRFTGLKEKDLVGIPWRVAFALQEDGWYLRSDIIWAKGNGMPEAVKDRPTKAHEYIFLLTKEAHYYYDHEAIFEPFVSLEEGKGRNKRSVWNINPKPYKGAHFAVFPEAIPALCIQAGTSEGGACSKCGTPWERGQVEYTWKPGCSCDPSGTVPCIVLDPFSGSGTTLAVAAGLRRSYLGIELNPAYHKLIQERLAGPLLSGEQQDVFDELMGD